MPGKVLLVSANRCIVPEAVFPLGLAHVNACLRAAGHDTRWFDVLVDSERFEDVLREYHPDWVGISLRNVDDVLIHTRETYFETVTELCATVRRIVGCPVVLGGSGFSVFPEKLLATTGADFGIRGEGEEAFPRLLEALESGDDPRAIPGLVHRDDCTIRVNPPAPRSSRIALTPDDRPAGMVAHYLRASSMLNLQTQRGCAHACCYCTYPLIEGRCHRRIPPAEVADAMEQLASAGAQYVFIVDSIFNSSPTHVAETCEAIVRRGTKLQWSCFLRPQGLTAELTRLMARAGLVHAEVGSDSLCDSVLTAYRKRFLFEDVLNSNEVLRAAGIECCHFLISGGPGETVATLDESFVNATRLGDVVIMPCVGMRIYPNTWLQHVAVREGRIAPDADLLTPVYYLAPGLDEETIHARLRGYAAQSPGWLLRMEQSGYQRVVERLRKRGVIGPLWSYFSTIQRLTHAAKGSYIES